jgi:hypothetical protein
MKKTAFIFSILSLLIPSLIFAQKEFNISGIMQHSDLEGGCWFLQSGKFKYELTGSPENLRICKVEGRPLVLRVRQAKMMSSVCMIGKMVEVIEVLDTVFHPHDPPVFEKKITGTIHKTKEGCWYVRATDKRRYELLDPVPEKFMHVGMHYSRISKVLPKTESQCGLDGVITISMLEKDMKKDQAKEKKNDPR